MKKHLSLLALLMFTTFGCGGAQSKPTKPALTVAWPLAATDTVGGYEARSVGAPKLEASGGPALCFDGQQDGLEVFINPLDLQTAFTVEVLFKPNAQGGGKQQFLHLEDANQEARLLMETRRAEDGRWHLHSFVRSHAGEQQLSSTGALHAPDSWYWAAVTYSEGWLRHFINGREEQAAAFQYRPMQGGKMGLGARLTHQSWFNGCIGELRFANDALPPGQLQQRPTR